MIKAGVPVEKLSRTKKYSTVLKKLSNERIDLYVGSFEIIENSCKEVGCNTDDFEEVYTLSTSFLCYAFNKSTPDMAIDKLQAALDELVSSGRAAEIKKRYGK